MTKPTLTTRLYITHQGINGPYEILVAEETDHHLWLDNFHVMLIRNSESESKSESAPASIPCRALFKRLSESDPARLLEMLESGELDPPELTFAAEIAGERVQDASASIPVLLRLLKHTSPLVREGAVYGLSCHLLDPRVDRALTEVSETDPSPGVREAASDALS